MELFGIPIEIITPMILVIVTIFYSIFTLFIFFEQRKSRKELSKPLISAKPYFIGPIAMYIQVANLGKGTALNVEINCDTNPPSSKKKWKTNFFPPNDETIEIGLDKIYLKELFNNYNEIIVKAIYEDIYGKNYEQTIKIDLNKLQESLKGKGIIYRDDFYQQIEDIRKKLKELGRNTRGLDKIERKLDELNEINKDLKRLNDINKTINKIK